MNTHLYLAKVHFLLRTRHKNFLRHYFNSFPSMTKRKNFTQMALFRGHEGVSKCTFGLHPRGCVRMAKMQGAEDEGAGSVLKYMTKPESDSNEADWLL